MIRLVIRFQKFLLIGAIGLAINVAGLYLLTEYLEIYYVLSSFVAIEISLVVTFTFNELWTWGDRSPGTVARRFCKYQLVNGVGLCINVGTLFLMASLLGVHYMLANLVGAGLAALWNFTLNNVFTWGDLGGSTTPGNFGDPRKPSLHEALVNKRRKLSVVIPALNESDAIQQVIHEVPREGLEQIGYEVQILVVDNASTDGTGELAKEAGAEVLLETLRGYGNAYKAGLKKADGDIILCCDADLTYPLYDVPSLIARMDAEGLQFVTTNRLIAADPGAMAFRNRIGNLLLTGVMGLLFGFSLKDSQSGMWIIRKELLDQLTLESGGMALSQEIKIKAIRATKAWRQVPIQYRKRVGEVKLNAVRDGLGNLINLFKLRWQL